MKNIALTLICLILIRGGLTIYSLPTEENDNDIDLDGTPDHLSTHELYGELARSRRAAIDMIVLFYHPYCPHCHLFMPKFYSSAKNIKKAGLALNIFMADCGLYPHFIPAFSIQGFPYLVYFHKGLPYDSMPVPLTLAAPLTEAWIKDELKTYNEATLDKSAFEGTSLKNEEDFFKRYQLLLRAHLFSKKSVTVADPNNPGQMMTLEALPGGGRKMKKQKMNKKKKSKRSNKLSEKEILD